MTRPGLTRLALASSIAALGCQDPDPDPLGSVSSAVQGGSIPSQLRGYDLGPPFPGGFRDSGLVNGYAEGEWVPFVAIMEGATLEDADALAGGQGDGRYRASIIVPTFSTRHGANAISNLSTSGTYGEGDLRPIPDPFDDRWLKDNGYSPFVLGAYGDSGAVDLTPGIAPAAQKSGPTRFAPGVASVAVPIEFDAPADESRVELRFAVRLAPPRLERIEPAGQGFPGDATSGDALGAADYFPGPGPIFVGYEVDKPTGIATVPIRVERHRCESDDECPPGEGCGAQHTCVEPCTDDSTCPSDQVCEDGTCQEPPPACAEESDCAGEDACVGGYCVPPCPTDDPDADPSACDHDTGEPPCVRDEQCTRNFVCEDGVCQPCDHPCDQSCWPGLECREGYCEEPLPPECLGNNCPDEVRCASPYDCAGGELCVEGVCQDGGGNVKTCDDASDCTGYGLAACIDGVCGAGGEVARLSCEAGAICPAGHACQAGQCVRLEGICELDGDCVAGQRCLSGWCGEPCADGSCGAGDTCALDRCVPSCEEVTECGDGEMCFEGGCVPEFAFVGQVGGEQSLWQVEGGGAEVASSDGGGCSTSGQTGGGLALVGLALALGLAQRSRQRSRP